MDKASTAILVSTIIMEISNATWDIIKRLII
jgi:hypothetical protein